MSDAGYVYVLLNPSMEGLVKVGRTTRDPRDRAKELSLATGVPTPFLLAFFRFFSDSQQGEQYVHALLEQKGYRLTANREFFNAPLHEVVDAILQASTVVNGQALQLSSMSGQDADLVSATHDDFPDVLRGTSDHANLGKDLLKKADASYSGDGETLQDYSEAMRLYTQAARLGAVEAHCRLGRMYMQGIGCAKDRQKALDCFQEAVRKGDLSGYAEMAGLFDAESHLENARKCWDRFFAGGGIHADSGLVGHYCYQYFVATRRHNWPLDHLEALRQVKDQLQKVAEEVVNYGKEKRDRIFTTLSEERLNAIRLL